VARELDEDELIGNWTLVGDELEQLSGRRGATKLGFALLLRFYAVHGRFPAGRSELPDQAVAHVARLVGVPASDLGFYEWDGRTIKAHRTDIRRYFGFRECSVADADKAAEWLAANVCEKERQPDRVREELLAYLKREQVEPPARDRIRRVVGTALRHAEQALTTRIVSRVSADAAARLRALITRAADPGAEEDAGPGDDGALFGAAEVTGVDVFAAIRDEPGNVSVKTIGQEAFKLGAIRAVGLPGDLFADVAPKVLAGWRARVAAEAPSHLRTGGPGAKRAGRGQAASRDKWPVSGPVRDWLAYCDQVRQDNGTPSLRTLQERMHLAFGRVGELLRSELPVDEEQARALLRALGAEDGNEVNRGIRLYKAARAERGPDGAGCGAAGLVAAPPGHGGAAALRGDGGPSGLSPGRDSPDGWPGRASGHDDHCPT
jgi:Domain of unknown function (DUF4158)